MQRPGYNPFDEHWFYESGYELPKPIIFTISFWVGQHRFNPWLFLCPGTERELSLAFQLM